MYFLWGGRYPRDRVKHPPRTGKWWRQYTERLTQPPAAISELERSTADIAALLPHPSEGEVAPNPVRGLVVGAVQSGKTAHMIGLAARALDSGYSAVVVLGGLKDDLRAQTALRFNTQLLRQRDERPNTIGGFTLSAEDAVRIVEGVAPPFHLDAHEWRLFSIRANEAAETGRPIVAVVKKNPAALSALRERLSALSWRVGRDKFAVLVLDDECDEASVEPSERRPIPQLISNLWRTSNGEPVGRLAYVGYTATAAANLLQQDDNELYPSDFVYLLRSPGSHDTDLTFSVPDSEAWYCGSEVFHGLQRSEANVISDCLVETTVSDDPIGAAPRERESLRQAIRYFLLGAAFRSLEHRDVVASGTLTAPPIHTMIVQASLSRADHEVWAEAVREFLGIGTALGEVDVAKVSEDCELNAAEWQRVTASLDDARRIVNETLPHPRVHRLYSWSHLRDEMLRLLVDVSVRVLNSSPGATEALDFTGHRDAAGNWTAPKDRLAIIVGGAKLSRGLTIEGLAVSYYVRTVDLPAEDTILQLCRWFGYRGAHLEYCRVITSRELAEELSAVHEHDRELRLRLASLMRRQLTPRSAGLVLASVPHGLPTAKLGAGKLRDVSYSPWCRVLRVVEIGDYARENESVAVRLVDEIRQRGCVEIVSAAGSLRGQLSHGWSVREIATLLEKLQFSHHNPDEHLALMASHYRACDSGRAPVSSIPEELDPYALAAYLRKWAEDAERLGTGTPLFNVGVAFGRENSESKPFDFPLANREISAAGVVNGGWVGASDGWAGDQFFDGVGADNCVPGTANRLESAPGLLLLYVAHKDARGRRGRGVTRSCHTPFFGISVPSGGPLFRRVTVAPRED